MKTLASRVSLALLPALHAVSCEPSRLAVAWRIRVFSLFPLPFRVLQPLRHLLVVRGVARPALCSGIPSVVLDGHVDAAVDEELHRLVVPMPDELVQDARRLVGAPRGVDIGTGLEEKISHV